MPVLVQKFGGTSVNTPEKRDRVLDLVTGAKDKGYDVVVVVSAMGRNGEPYATDTFLGLLKEVGPNASARTMDLLSSCGEIISTCIVAHALEQRGYRAVPMTGSQAGIATDDCFTNATITDINPAKLRKALNEGCIVVVAGFQGVTADNDVSTLGRGGSDTTAIALGGALKAERVEIYTDVPGVAFTDPRLLSEAPYLTSIDFYPIYLMSRAGAKVVHHRAVKTAIDFNMPFVVKSTFSDEEGTLIGKKGESFGGIYGIAVMKDLQCIRSKSEDKNGMWSKKAVDELFFHTGPKGTALVVQDASICAGDLEKDTSADECAVLSVIWEQASGISAERIRTVLLEKGIRLFEYFPLPQGAAWAIDALGVQEAVQAIFHTVVRIQEKKAV